TSFVCCWLAINCCNGRLSVSLPSCCLICISQMLATLTITLFVQSSHRARACCESLLGSLTHQMKMCVSKSSFTLALSRTRQGEAKARHDLVPVQCAVRTQGARGGVSPAPFVDLSARRPDHPHERHAALQPLLRLAVHLLARLSGRGGLDDQVGHDARKALHW